MRYRVEWAKFQERERKKEEEEREKERVAYAQIDWHDFVVVETVDFQPNEQGDKRTTIFCKPINVARIIYLYWNFFLSRSLPTTDYTRGAWCSHPDSRAL